MKDKHYYKVLKKLTRTSKVTYYAIDIETGHTSPGYSSLSDIPNISLSTLKNIKYKKHK